MSQTIVFVFALAFVFSNWVHAENNQPARVKFSLEKSWIPVGFDDNDRAQVVVEGTFPNTCFKIDDASTQVSLEEKGKTIKIFQKAYKYEGPCQRVLVPFSQVVNIGVLGQGTYKVQDGLSGKLLGKLVVTKSSHPGPDPDDHLYAPVTEAFVTRNTAQAAPVLVLRGSFTNRCLRFKEVQVHRYPDVVVVQPIVEQIAAATCKTEYVRFNKRIALDETLRGTSLLHVRSMDGQAINRIVNFDGEDTTIAIE